MKLFIKHLCITICIIILLVLSESAKQKRLNMVQKELKQFNSKGVNND